MSAPATPATSASKANQGRWIRLAEDAFFILTVAFGFTVVALIAAQGNTPIQRAFWLILCWALLAYLALPRLNQLLTTIYVPDYFIGRTRTSSGILGDAVNVALCGSGDQIHQAMQRAGWVRADPVTLQTSWGIIVSSVTRRSYPSAPVSPLFLFGRMEDFAYQQEVDGNASQRHHVRFWKTPPGWVLPGGHRVDWLAAGSYDRAVGLSLFTLQVTHKVASDIDLERDHIVQTVCAANPGVSVRLIEDFSTGYHSRNGGGDEFHTDGDLKVLELGSVAAPAQPAPPLTQKLGDRPVSVAVAAALSVVSTVLTTIRAFVDLFSQRMDGLSELDASNARVLGIVAIVLLSLLGLALSGWVYQGRAWARISLLLLTAPTLAGHVGLGRTNLITLAEVLLSLGIMFALTSESARDWTGST